MINSKITKRVLPAFRANSGLAKLGSSQRSWNSQIKGQGKKLQMALVEEGFCFFLKDIFRVEKLDGERNLVKYFL